MKHLLLLTVFLTLFQTIKAQTIAITGSMITPRNNHRAELLPDGKVLVMGGDNSLSSDIKVYNSSETYDPYTQQWSTSASMSHKRHHFASAVLRNGNIIVCGGNDSGEMLSSAEVYDLQTQTWHPIANMKIPRQDHHALTLPDGKILVVGSGSMEYRCEIYDPLTNTWSFTGELPFWSTSLGSAVTLQNKKVLYTQGNRGTIYHPEIGEWTLVAQYPKRTRIGHSSVVLNDGRVLLAGTSPLPTLDYLTPEFFNPLSQEFSITTKLLLPVASSKLVLLDDGHVLAFGTGDPLSPSDTKCMQIFNPDTERWTAPVTNHVGTDNSCIIRLHSGKILLIGGIGPHPQNIASSTCVLITQSESPECIPPATNLTAFGIEDCLGKDGIIHIQNTEPGVIYQAFIDNTKVGNSSEGETDINIVIPHHYLNVGKNLIQIRVMKPGCVDQSIPNSITIGRRQEIIPQPTINPDGPLNICPESSLTLTVSTDFPSYRWSDGSSSKSITVNYSGAHTVRGVDAEGCVSKPSVTLKTFLYPNTIDAGDNMSICNSDEPFTLIGAMPIGGKWTGANITDSGFLTPEDLIPGDHIFTYSVCDMSDTRRISVNPGPHIDDFTIETVNDTICRMGSVVINLSNTTIGIRYTLQRDNEEITRKIATSNGPMELRSYSNKLDSEHRVVASINNLCGTNTLIKTKKITVEEIPNKIDVITPDTICKAGVPIFQIEASRMDYFYKIKGSNLPDTFAFVQGNGGLLTLKSSEIYHPTRFTIEADNRLRCGLTSIFSKLVQTYDHQVDFSNNLAYFEDAPISILNTSNGDFFQWQFDSSATLHLYEGKNPPSFAYTSIGTKSISLTSHSRFGCANSITKKVDIFTPAPRADGSICLWDTLAESSSIHHVLNFHIDAEKNAYVTGLNFAGSPQKPSPESQNGYITKYNPNGEIQWQLKHNIRNYNNPPEFYSLIFNAITTDPSGNVYVTGSYCAVRLKFDDILITHSNPLPQAFVLKINKNGIVQWVIHGINNNRQYKEQGAADIIYVNDDEIYVSLFKGGEMKFSDNQEIHFKKALSIMKINSQGHYINHHEAGEDSNGFFNIFNPDRSVYHTGRVATMGPVIKRTQNGHIVLTGEFSSPSVTFGEHKIQQLYSPSRSGYVAILDPYTGWKNAFTTYAMTLSTHITIENLNTVPAIALDQDDNIYLAEYYNYSNDRDGKFTLPDNFQYEGLFGNIIMKYNTDGDLVWHKRQNHGVINNLHFDKSNNQLLAYGTTVDNLFGQLANEYKAIQSSGSFDGVLLSLSSNGNLNWMENIGGESLDLGYFIRPGADDNIYLLGRLGGAGSFSNENLINSAKHLYLAQFSPISICSSTVTKTEMHAYTSDFSIYPNPSAGQLSLTGLPNGEYCKISVSTLSGIEVFREKCNGSTSKTIDLSTVSQGVYIISIYGDTEIKNQKLLITK